jgi:dienelactone hydrolase
MSGLGERGSNPQMLLASGVPHDLSERREVLKWLPMIMVAPQCPADARYEDDHVGRGITGLIDEISRRYPVDATRRYITGFSMGGTGCWSVARFARERLAVVAPIVPRVFQPSVLSEALARTGTTCLVISGEVDPKSEPGSAEMVKALRGRGVDVVYAMIPKGDHYLWPWYYHDKRFYEWLLSHRQASPKPTDRMGEQALVEMARARSSSNDRYLAKLSAQLQQFAPWWHIDNCQVSGEQGLCPEAYGRHNVFKTRAYYPAEAPCRLQSTQTLPQAGPVALHLVVGRHPDGDWKLTVRINEQEVLSTPINKDTAPDQWKTIDVDLSKYAGQEVRMQLCQSGISNFQNGQAYWETIKIVSGDAAATQPVDH